VAIETELLRNRMASRGAPGPNFRRGTPRRTEPSCGPYSIAKFAAIVERANTTGSLPQAVGPQASVAMTSDTHPDQRCLQVRRSRPEPTPWGRESPQAEEVCAYDRGPDRRPWPRFPPTSDPPSLVFPPPRPARPKSRPAVVPYLASIDTTLKELDAELVQTRLMTPFMDRVTRVLERLEQREAREARPVPVAPTPPRHVEYTTRPTVQSAPEPPVRERNTLHRYYSRSIDSPPASEPSYREAAYTPRIQNCCKTVAYKPVSPVRPAKPPDGDAPPRRWFHTAAGEWIDLDKLDPVDWSAVSANFKNSVAHLQLPFREGHTAKEDMLTARPQCKPPADIYFADDHTVVAEEAAWNVPGVSVITKRTLSILTTHPIWSTTPTTNPHE